MILARAEVEKNIKIVVEENKKSLLKQIKKCR